MAKATDNNRSIYTVRIPLSGDLPTWEAPRAIRIVRPGQREFVVPLLTEREYLIGRAETADLYFEDESVSRFHGFLSFDAASGAWAYRDTGSTFGSALADPADRGPAGPIPPPQAIAVMAGHVVALGTRGSRIELLEDVPADALATSGETAWKSEAARVLEDRIQAASGHSLPLFLLGASGSG